ncbi:hypothetical protein AVEN_189062-1 [Araneus ventricosus]|uniref:Uncharacterized protein n=1 Tax=Araneus ventricosus TaxID=182803 RepID=A0A4Y2JLE7_ARAVE|nr:hypothetical protein AVEN_189062-1 [Araneus ventricosus]
MWTGKGEKEKGQDEKSTFFVCQRFFCLFAFGFCFLVQVRTAMFQSPSCACNGLFFISRGMDIDLAVFFATLVGRCLGRGTVLELVIRSPFLGERDFGRKDGPKGRCFQEVPATTNHLSAMLLQ